MKVSKILVTWVLVSTHMAVITSTYAQSRNDDKPATSQPSKERQPALKRNTDVTGPRANEVGSSVPLTVWECGQLGGRVEIVSTPVCRTGLSCRTRNQDNIEGNVCINKF